MENDFFYELGLWKKGKESLFYLMMSLELIISITSAIGCQAYGHCDIFPYRKPTVATEATLSNKQQGIFYMHCPADRTAHTTAFDGPVVWYWLQRGKTPTNAPAMQAWSDDPNLYRRLLYWAMSRPNSVYECASLDVAESVERMPHVHAPFIDVPLYLP